MVCLNPPTRIASDQREPAGRTSWAIAWAWVSIPLFWAFFGFGQEPRPEGLDAPSQERVAHLLQKVIQDYWNGAEAKSSSTTNAESNAHAVEAAFREASRLMPGRLDLRFGVASALMSQALQTNGTQLTSKVKEALTIYQEIQALDTNGFEAAVSYAAYTRSIGETNASAEAIRTLMNVHPQRTMEYARKFDTLDGILRITPNSTLPMRLPNDAHHAIVVLGAGLDTNGTMKTKLADRLGQCLKLARLYPSAPIILTGGNQMRGVTEAYVMSRWCTQRGISRKRLMLEDRSKDTVENAVFSAAILQRLGVTQVTLVTSSSHVRRALADFEEACRQRGLEVRFEHVAARTKGDKDLDPQQEIVGCYRDVMRTSGIWDFPGIRR